MLNDQPVSALGQLMLGYAEPRQRPLHQLCWALDARLAGIAQSVREPAIASIRLAWWRDALVRDDRNKGRGDPLIEAWRRQDVTAHQAACIDQLIDGWHTLVAQPSLDVDQVREFGTRRGGGLFGLLAGPVAAVDEEGVRAAGAFWSLWDLAGHVQQPDAAALCLAEAAKLAPLAHLPKGAAFKPLRLMTRLAAQDVRHGRWPKGGFAARHYLKLLVTAPFS